MRVVGGRFRNRRINPPNSMEARPTTDYAKEGLFNVLQHSSALEDIRVLDLFAGTGSISRADNALFWSSGYYKVVRAGGWKLQVNGRQQKSWLFNLNEDPTEQTNLAASEPEKRAELQALIDAHWKDAREPLYPYTIESPIKIDNTIDAEYVEGEEYVYWPN